MLIQDLLLTERTRPKRLNDVILPDVDLEAIRKYIASPKSMPSFLLYSRSPGTGKTSCAKVIARELDTDILVINSSDERGIDVIRDKVSLFVRSMSSNSDVKRCVFLDEACGLTKAAQDSMRNLIETYSDNAFFILSCNDENKIVDALKSRMICISFAKPPKDKIISRLEQICEKENIALSIEKLISLVDSKYPDIRSMVNELQHISQTGARIDHEAEYRDLLEVIKKKDLETIYKKTYSGNLDTIQFIRWMFRHLFDNHKQYGLQKCGEISLHLAEFEKGYTLGINPEICFISCMVRVMKCI